MKTLHIASILVLSAFTAFACGDDDTNNNNNHGGSAGQSAAGEGGAVDNGGSAGKAGGAGTATIGGGGAGGEGGAMEPCVDDVIGGAGGAGDAGGAAAGGAAAGGAAGAGGAEAVSSGLEIVGTWKESFGGDLVITSKRWNDGTIVEYDNDANVVYTHNSCADFNPKKYSKYVYTNPVSDSFYYCTIVFDAPTLAAAKADKTVADAKDLDGKGCNGFPWSKVTKL